MIGVGKKLLALVFFAAAVEHNQGEDGKSESRGMATRKVKLYQFSVMN
jgi:hypothetical protein